MRQRKVVLAKLSGPKAAKAIERKQFDADRIFDVADWRRQLAEDADAFLTDLFLDAGEDAASILGVTFDATDPLVVELVQAQSNRLAGVNDTTYQAIKDAIAAGEAEGETVAGVAKRIRGVFSDATTWRAETIARTEGLSAVRGASWSAARQAAGGGAIVTKTWLATFDRRTRPDHRDADGQTQPVDTPYIVGGSELMYPGDPLASGAQTINCRCSETYETGLAG